VRWGTRVAALVVVTSLLGWAVSSAADAAGPTASFSVSPSPPYVGEQVTFQSTSTGSPTSEQWDLDGDGTYGDAKGSSATATFDTPGPHTVGLMVSDGTNSDEHREDVKVIDRPVASFDYTPATPRAGEPVTFSSTSRGDVTKWDWDLNGDGAAGDASTASPSHTFDSAGSYDVTLTVTDSRGTTATASRTVKVAGPAPPYAVSDKNPKAGDHVTFDGSALGQGHGGAVDYKWDLDGNGTLERDTRLDPAVGVTYGAPGVLDTALVITFGDGTSARFGGTVIVGEGAAPADCLPYCHVDFPFHAPGAGGGGPPSCQTSAEFGLVVAEADCLVEGPGGTLSSTGRVRVNGLDVIPTLGSSIVLDPVHFTITSATPAAIQFGELPLALVPVNWTGLAGTGGQATTPNYLAPPGSSLVEGFPQAGRQEITFHSHRATFNTEVSLPEVVGGVDAALRLSVDSDHPATLDELHLSVPAGQLQGSIPLHNIVLDYAAAANAWGGALGIDIGDYSVDAGIGFHLDPSFALDHITAAISGLNVPVSSGVFLDAIRIAYGTVPDPDHPGSTFNTLGGGITLTYGGSYNGQSLIAVDGDFVVTLSNPAVIDLTGEGRVVGQKFAAMTSRYSLDGNFTFDANLRIGLNAFPPSPRMPPYWEDSDPVPAVRIEGRVNGWVDGPRRTFDAEGSGQACVLVVGCLGGRAVISSRGAAGCGFLGRAGVGVGYDWRTRAVAFIGGACDLGTWREVRASAAAATGQHRLALPAGLAVAAFRITGQGGPPAVTVAGPKGERLVAPGSANRTPTTLVTQAGNDTYVVVAHPSGGAWTIAANAGSAPIVAATEARALPPISVTARVTGRGRRRALRYRVRPIAGQQVVFAERGATLGRTLGTASRARGTLRFSPADGPAGRRTIVATVSQYGLPRRQLVVARYVAPGPLRPGPPRRLALRRRRGALQIRWSAASGKPRFYDVLVTSVNRRRLLFELPGSARGVTFPRLAAGDRAVVTVRGLTRTRQPGRAARAVSSP
jgi:PKD repeat protein